MTLCGRDHEIFQTARRLAACRHIARTDEHPDAYISQWENEEAENELDAEAGDDDFAEYCEGGGG